MYTGLGPGSQNGKPGLNLPGTSMGIVTWTIGLKARVVWMSLAAALTLAGRYIGFHTCQQGGQTNGDTGFAQLRQTGGGMATGRDVAQISLRRVDFVQRQRQIAIPSQRVPGQVEVRVKDQFPDRCLLCHVISIIVKPEGFVLRVEFKPLRDGFVKILVIRIAGDAQSFLSN